MNPPFGSSYQLFSDAYWQNETGEGAQTYYNMQKNKLHADQLREKERPTL